MLAPANHGGGLMPGALPLFAAAIAWASGTERASRRQLGGMLVIVLGIALLLGESILAATPRQLLGDACFLGGSAAWAAYAVLIRRWHVPPLGAVVLPNVLTGVVFLPVYFLLLDPRLDELPTSTLLLQGGYHGLVATIVSTGLFAYAVRRLGPARTTIITAFTPVLVALAAIPLLDEWPTALGAAGLAAVTFGILIGVGRVWRSR
jgi:drug/metabolite transporter (DMT)-like permease